MPAVDSVSIVVPCYNCRGTVVETVRSALSQQGVSLEVIVVDDGSTDGLELELRNAGLLERVQFLVQENRGVSAARNRGLDAARGRYICFLDSDDVLDPRFAVEMVELLRVRSGRFAYCNYQYFADAPGRPPMNIRYPTHEGLVAGHILSENFIPTPGAVLLERSLLGALRFDTTRQGTEDWYLWMRLLCSREPVYFHPECLVRIRVRPLSLGGRKAAMILETASLFDEAEKLAASSAITMTRRQKTRFYYRVASALLDANRPQEAMARWARATVLGLGVANHSKLAAKTALSQVGLLRHVERVLWRKRLSR